MKNIILLIALFGWIIGSAQNTVPMTEQITHYNYDNLIKYCDLRQLMRDKLLLVSDAQGGGRVFSVRQQNCWSWELNMSNNCALNNTQCDYAQCGLINQGDYSSMAHYYIITLATEYELLTRSNQLQERDQETVKELYYALKSVYRSITKAYELYGQYGVTDAHAWMLRDEASALFWQNFAGRGDWAAVNSNLGCFTPSQLGDKQCDYHMFASQDQIIFLLEGLAFIKRYVPATATYNGESILGLAQDLAEGIISDMHDAGWRIYTPDGYICPLNSGKDGGRRALTYAWAIDNVGEYIYGYKMGDYDCGVSTSSDFPYVGVDANCPDLFYKWLWELEIGRLPPNVVFSINFANVIPAIIFALAPETILLAGVAAALLNVVIDPIHVDLVKQGKINAMLYDVVGATSNKRDISSQISDHKDHNAILPISQILLHNLTPSTADMELLRNNLESELNLAPCNMMCNYYCPANSSQNCWGVPSSQPIMTPFAFNGKDGWRTGDKWNSINDYDETYNGNPNSHKLNPGVDYMMAYNLYQLAFTPDMYFGNTNASPGNVVLGPASNILFSSTTLGTEPLTVEGGDVNTRNITLPANGNLEIRASSSIKMTNNTVFKASSYAKAYIGPFECDQTTGNIITRLAPPGNQIVDEETVINKDTISILKDEKTINLVVYPNPVTEVLNISIKDFPNETLDLFVYDLYGKLLIREQIKSDEVQISTVSLETGTYILQLLNQQNSITHKFIKL